jgi:hypothetical protein
MNIRLIRQLVAYFAMLFLVLVLIGCENTTPTPMPDTTTPIIGTPRMTATPSLTASPLPLSARNTRTATPTFDLTADYLTNPPPTPTGTPVVDADGNVTWHPQKELISWSDSGGDGVYYSYNRFTLFWDGTLLQSGNSSTSGVPYLIQLSRNEVCKTLNTVDASGFFEEPNYYNFPFDGLGGSSISVTAWKSNSSGAQILDSAISGDPYSDVLFCRNCPIPSAETIIQTGFANTYYFLQNYRSPNPQKVPVNEILVEASPVEIEGSAPSWPLTSMSLEQFTQLMKQCQDDRTCSYEGMTFGGEAAREIMEKIGNGGRIESTFFGTSSISIYYRPKAPDMPPDYTLTCNTKSGHYPILPLDKNNKFWYYAPGGKWGAEVVANQNKIRVVNISGYEKFYQYDAAFFGQPSIQFYPRFWSQDGQFFYVNILPEPFTPSVSLVNSIGLQQIDVKNEKIKYLLLGAEGQPFAYEFSEDGKKVAYIRQGDTPLKLVVVDTYSGEEKAVSLTMPDGIPYSSAGTLVWSPEGDKIFMSAVYEDNGLQKTHILAIDTNNLANIRIVYKDDKPIKLRLDFDGTYANICDMQAGGDDNCLIDLHLDTGEVKDWSK